jgi:hypothetical protein
MPSVQNFIADTWVFDMEKGKRASFRQKHFNGLFWFFELELPSPPPPTEKRPEMNKRNRLQKKSACAGGYGI